MTLLTTAAQCCELARVDGDNHSPSPLDGADIGPGAALAILAAGQFLMVLDVSIVNVALPAMQAELGIADGDVQYVASLYAVTFGGLLIFAARLADRFGRRRMVTAGLVLFAVASGLTGMAESPQVLFAGRLVLGVAAAMVSPAALALALAIFTDGPQRRRAMSAWGAVAAIGGVAGLLVGGVLTDALGWRWVFFIDVIPAFVVAVLTMRLLPESKVSAPPRTDLRGAALLLTTISALVVALTRTTSNGWGDPTTVILFVVSGLAGLALVVVERRVSEPMIEWAILSNLQLAGANLAALLISALIVSQGVFVSIYLQSVLGFSAVDTGLALSR